MVLHPMYKVVLNHCIYIQYNSVVTLIGEQGDLHIMKPTLPYFQ